MTRIMTTTTAIIALTAGAAFAVTDIETVDMDGDGFASIEEMRVVYPELTAVFFDGIDANDDNRVSPEEMISTEAQDILARYEMTPVENRRPTIVLDADADGFIALDDLRRAYPEFSDLDFDAMDSNGDERLSYEEFYELDAQDTVAKYQTGTVTDIAEIDTNGDNFADFNEMVAVFPGLDEESFDDIDQNGDNRVSSSELYAPDAQDIVSRSGS